MPRTMLARNIRPQKSVCGPSPLLCVCLDAVSGEKARRHGDKESEVTRSGQGPCPARLSASFTSHQTSRCSLYKRERMPFPLKTGSRGLERVLGNSGGGVSATSLSLASEHKESAVSPGSRWTAVRDDLCGCSHCFQKRTRIASWESSRQPHGIHPACPV